MSNIIKLKNSGTASATPSYLEYGELALNYNDEKIFYRNSLNEIAEFDLSLEALIGPQGPQGPQGPPGTLSTGVLDDLSDVSTSMPSSGDFLKWNGTAWINDSIDLGSDTTGNYVSSLVAGTGVALTNNSGEGATPTISIGQAVETSSSVSFSSVTAGGVTAGVSGSTTISTDSGDLTIAPASLIVNIGNDLVATGSITGSSIITNSIVFEGSTADANETTLQVADPTADRTITLPNATGTVSLAEIIIAQQTANYTLVLSDKDKMVEMNVGSANNLTVPPDSTDNFAVGSQITILQTGTGQTTIVAGSGVTVNATPGLKLRARWSSVTLIKRAANTWVALGDLQA
jgi:hypothetical protein